MTFKLYPHAVSGGPRRVYNSKPNGGRYSVIRAQTTRKNNPELCLRSHVRANHAGLGPLKSCEACQTLTKDIKAKNRQNRKDASLL